MKWRFELYGFIEAENRDEAKQKVAAITEHLKDIEVQEALMQPIGILGLEGRKTTVYSGNIVNPVMEDK